MRKMWASKGKIGRMSSDSRSRKRPHVTIIDDAIDKTRKVNNSTPAKRSKEQEDGDSNYVYFEDRKFLKRICRKEVCGSKAAGYACFKKHFLEQENLSNKGEIEDLKKSIIGKWESLHQTNRLNTSIILLHGSKILPTD